MSTSIENVKNAKSFNDFWEEENIPSPVPPQTPFIYGEIPRTNTPAPLKDNFLERLESYEMPALAEAIFDNNYIDRFEIESDTDLNSITYEGSEAYFTHATLLSMIRARFPDSPFTLFYANSGEKILFYCRDKLVEFKRFSYPPFPLNPRGGSYDAETVVYSRSFAKKAYSWFIMNTIEDLHARREILFSLEKVQVPRMAPTKIQKSETSKPKNAVPVSTQRISKAKKVPQVVISASSVYKTTYVADSLGVVHEKSLYAAAKDPKKKVLLSLYEEKKNEVSKKPYLILVMNGAFKMLQNSDTSFMRPEIVKDLQKRAEIIVHDSRQKMIRSNSACEIFENIPYIYGQPVNYNSLVTFIFDKSNDKLIATKEIGLLYRWYVKSFPGSGFRLAQYLYKNTPFWTKPSFLSKFAIVNIKLRETSVVNIVLDYDHHVPSPTEILFSGLNVDYNQPSPSSKPILIKGIKVGDKHYFPPKDLDESEFPTYEDDGLLSDVTWNKVADIDDKWNRFLNKQEIVPLINPQNDPMQRIVPEGKSDSESLVDLDEDQDELSDVPQVGIQIYATLQKLKDEVPYLTQIVEVLIGCVGLYKSKDNFSRFLSVSLCLHGIVSRDAKMFDQAILPIINKFIDVQIFKEQRIVPEGLNDLWQDAAYVFSHISVTAVLGGLGVYEYSGTSSIIKKLQNFLKLSRTTNFDTFMVGSLKFLQNLFTLISRCVSERSLQPLFETTKLSFSDIDFEVEFLCSYDNSIRYTNEILIQFMKDKERNLPVIPKYIHEPYTMENAKFRLEFLKGEIEKILQLNSISPIVVKPTLDKIVGKISNLTARMGGATYRIPAFGVFIYGPPGNGKTTIIRNFTSIVLAMHGLPQNEVDNQIYTKPMNTEFWDGVKPNVTTLFIDDADQLKKADVNMASCAEMWNQGCSSGPWRVAMAHLEEKGMFISPKLVVQASNNADGGYNAVLKETAVDSLQRRMKLKITVKPKPEFAAKKNLPNLKAIKDSGNQWVDCFEYRISEYNPTTEMIRDEERTVTFNELMALFGKAYRKHREDSKPPVLHEITCLRCCVPTCACPDEAERVETIPEAKWVLLRLGIVYFLIWSLQTICKWMGPKWLQFLRLMNTFGTLIRGIYYIYILPIALFGFFEYLINGMIFGPIAFLSFLGIYTMPIAAWEFITESGPTYSLYRFVTNVYINFKSVSRRVNWPVLGVSTVLALSAVCLFRKFHKEQQEQPEMLVTNAELIPTVTGSMGKVREKNSHPWIDYVPKYPIPATVPQTFDQMIYNRSVELYNIETHNSLYGFMTSGFTIVCPKHFFFPIGSNDFLGNVSGRHNIRIRQHSKEITVNVSRFYNHEGVDLVEFFETNLNLFVKPDEKFEDYLLDDHDSWESYARNKPSRLLSFDKEYLVEGPLMKRVRAETRAVVIAYNAPTQGGDCIMTLVTGQKVMGWHVARMMVGNEIAYRFAERYTKSMHRRARKFFENLGGDYNIPIPEGQVVDMLPNLVQGSNTLREIPLIANIHVDMALRREAKMDLPHLLLFNQKGTFNSTFVSNFKPTPYKDHPLLESFFQKNGTSFSRFKPVEVHNFTATLKGRELEGYQTPYTKNLISSCATSPDYEVVAQAAATFLDVELPDDVILRPLTLAEVVTGTCYLNGTSNQSSGGHPYGKNLNIYEKFPGEKVDISKVVQQEFDKIVNILKTGKLYTPSVKRQIKDEIRTVEQIKKFKVRLFSVGKAPFLAVCKSYLGPLAYIMQTHNKALMNTLGYNLSDQDNREIMLHLQYFVQWSEGKKEFESARRLAKYILALDAKNFDMVGSTLITFFIGIVIMTLLMRFGYSYEDAKIAWFCFLSSFYCMNEMKGDYFTCNHALASGMFHTFMYNCLKSALAYIIAYIRLVPSELRPSRPYKGLMFSSTSFPTFREHVHALFGGDDAIAQIAEMIAKYYNQQSIKTALLDVFDVQPEKKEQEMQEFLVWDQARFLKRSFHVIYYQDKSYCVCPLEFDSLAKTLSYTDSTVQEWDTTVPRVKLDNFVRELFHYGIDVFTEGLSIVNIIEDELGWPKTIHTYSSLAEKHAAGTMQSWS